MVLMIRVEAGRSSGAEGIWLSHHDGNLCNRGKAVWPSLGAETSPHLYCGGAEGAHHHNPKTTWGLDEAGWILCPQQPIFAIIFATVKSHLLPQNYFLAPVMTQAIGTCTQNCLPVLKSENIRSNCSTEFENQNLKWLYSSWGEDVWDQFKLSKP